MKAEDVTATRELALQASGLDQAKLADRPRLQLGARNIKLSGISAYETEAAG